MLRHGGLTQSYFGRASYRDLLATAESIIEMDGEMQKVEVHLGDLGARCNTRLLEKKISNLRQWDTAVGAVGILTCDHFAKVSQS